MVDGDDPTQVRSFPLDQAAGLALAAARDAEVAGAPIHAALREVAQSGADG